MPTEPAVIPPASTEQAVAPAEKPAFDPFADPKPRSLAEEMESDPNHQMALMIAKRKTRAPKAEETTETPAAEKPTSPPDAPPKPELGTLLSKALKFRDPKPIMTAAEDGSTQAKEGAPPSGEDPKPATPPPAEKKTVVKKAKAPPAPVDPIQVATAVATASMRELAQSMRPEPAKDHDASADLDEKERYEYEVAKFLSETDPKFKGADKKFIENFKAAEKYAAKWEAANPGKEFNPEDDEHDDFFGGVRQAYSATDLERAKARMAAREVVATESEATNRKIQELEEENSRLSVTPKAAAMSISAARVIAKAMGDDVAATLFEQGPDKLAEDHPEAAEAMMVAMTTIGPMIEAILQIEAPKGKYDPKNQHHVAYAKLMEEKEAEYAGQELDGKTIVTRRQYAAMSPAVRQSHTYLSADNLIAELVDTESQKALQRVESERNRIAKMAERMGYVKAPNGAAAKPKSQATPAKESPPAGATNGTTVKPVSPSAGNGAKVGETASRPSGGYSGVLEKAASVLFPR